MESQHALLKKQLQSSQGAFETCWKQIHTLIESSHVAIKASFEKSKTVVQHRFKQPLWSEIRGRVSISALNLIFNSLNDLFDRDRDPSVCDCTVRSTCGLPCPHELTEYVKFMSPIPLNKIHAFWRKLDILPIVSYEDNIDEEIRNRYKDCCNTLDSRFEAAPRIGKNLIVRKLTEICYPETIVAHEPEVKINNKGRPRGNNAKLENSTKRDPSAFEYVEAIPDSVIFKSLPNQCSQILQVKIFLNYLSCSLICT